MEFRQSLGRTFSHRTWSRRPDSWAHNADAQELKDGCEKEQRKHDIFDKIPHINTIQHKKSFKFLHRNTILLTY